MSHPIPFIVVDIDPVVPDNSSLWKLHQFERLRSLSCPSWSNNHDTLPSNINTCSVNRMRVPSIFQNRGGHSESPALTLSIIFSVEEHRLVSVRAVVGGGLEPVDSKGRVDSSISLYKL